MRARAPPGPESVRITSVRTVSASRPHASRIWAATPSASQEAEQDVLGVDVVVAERSRLVLGEDDDLASPLAEALEHEARA